MVRFALQSLAAQLFAVVVLICPLHAAETDGNWRWTAVGSFNDPVCSQVSFKDFEIRNGQIAATMATHWAGSFWMVGGVSGDERQIQQLTVKNHGIRTNTAIYGTGPYSLLTLYAWFEHDVATGQAELSQSAVGVMCNFDWKAERIR